MIELQKEAIRLAVAGLTVKLIRVANFDELLDELIGKGADHPDYQDDRIPYWADLWHSALALAQYLVQQQAVRPDTTVVEIGCGLGLPGVVAGLLGAAEVTFTDYLPEAVAMARLNWEANLNRPARFLAMDWREPLPEASARLLLASDVAYEVRAFQPLMDTFDQLAQPGGRLIISEPNRKMASGWLDALRRKYPDHQLLQCEAGYRGVNVQVNVLDIAF
jgi:predicted nicotinamide N-methyase